MAGIGYAFREYVRDLPFSTYDATATLMSAMLVKSTWVVDFTISNISAITGGGTNYETTGSGYSRLAGFNLTTSNTDFGISLVINPTPVFATMTTTDWQYCVLYNQSTSKPYFLIDSGQQNTITGSTISLDNTPEPTLSLNFY